MAGIYIHIPFCKQACHYCNFHFSTSLKLRKPMLEAIAKELTFRKQYLEGQIVESIYLGGGTPSLLSPEELASIFQVIYDNFTLAQNLEITLEANPDDLSFDYLNTLKKETPVNRLSIGIQSFFEADLQYMNRAHSGTEASDCLQMALETGFKDLSIDFIYGTPTMSNEQWRQNLQKAFDLKIPHISCYALTVEPKTALQHLIVKGKAEEVNEEQTAQQFEILLEAMANHGYEQYEISNFCLPPHYAQHNSSYWKGAHYLGIGPSAHSFNGHSRQWNIANNALYITGLEQDNPHFEIEVLSIKEQYNEFLLTALRTKWGADLLQLRQNWGTEAESTFLRQSKDYLDKGLMLQEGNVFRLSNAGKLLADHIIADLFWV